MNKVLSYFLGLGVLIFALMAAIPVSVYDVDDFMAQAETNRVSQRTGLSDSELRDVAVEIFNYLEGERSDFDITINTAGQTRHLFNEDEQQHMVDVAGLTALSRILLAVSLLTLLCCGTILFLRDQRGLYRGLIYGGLWGLGLLIVLALLGSMDFTAVFEGAHRLIFSNDLWLLDPKKDLLINIVPEPYFIHLALRVAGMAAAMDLFFVALGIAGRVRMKRIESSEEKQKKNEYTEH